jgi:hypothetical protein
MSRTASRAPDFLAFRAIGTIAAFLFQPLRILSFPAIAALLLTGCQIGTKIEVRTINGITVFVVLREDGQVACVQTINVSEGKGEIGNPTKWSLIQNYADVQAGKNACNNVFMFGKPLKGYEQEYDGKPLEPGKTYYVSIGGGGLTGDRTFTVPK